MFRFLLSLFFTGGCVCNRVLDSAELINKLNFLEDEDQEAPPAMTTNPFDEPDDNVHANDLNPFGDPDEEGTFNSESLSIVVESLNVYLILLIASASTITKTPPSPPNRALSPARFKAAQRLLS